MSYSGCNKDNSDITPNIYWSSLLDTCEYIKQIKKSTSCLIDYQAISKKPASFMVRSNSLPITLSDSFYADQKK